MDGNYELMLRCRYALEEKQLINCNQYTQRFGLQLSQEDRMELVQNHMDVLKEQQRVEFGEGILPKLIFTFCDSPYIYQDNYVEMMDELVDVFYQYKNESMDEVTDDELLSYMKEQFDGSCEGSVEHLADTALEEFAREIREGSRSFIGRYKEETDE